jgi:hypothetical protein
MHPARRPDEQAGFLVSPSGSPWYPAVADASGVVVAQ